MENIPGKQIVLLYSSVIQLRLDDKDEAAAALLLGVVVRGVVRDVAMDQPFARSPRRPDHVVALPGPDIDGVREVAAFRGRVSPSRATT